MIALGLVVAEGLGEHPGVPLLQPQGQVPPLPGLVLLARKVLHGEEVHALEGPEAAKLDLGLVQLRRIQRDARGEP